MLPGRITPGKPVLRVLHAARCRGTTTNAPRAHGPTIRAKTTTPRTGPAMTCRIPLTSLVTSSLLLLCASSAPSQADVADVPSEERRVDEDENMRYFLIGADPAEKKTAVKGSYIAMSVFKRKYLPSLKRAKGKAYFLDHSPQDKDCPYSHAELAVKQLNKASRRPGDLPGRARLARQPLRTHAQRHRVARKPPRRGPALGRRRVHAPRHRG